MASTIAYAQFGPCAPCPTPPDYPGTPFTSGSYTYTINGSIGMTPCTVRVCYCYRTIMYPGTNIPLYHDLLITETAFYPASHCNGVGVNYKQVMENIIKTQNPHNASIPHCNTGQTQEIWRLMRGDCYATWLCEGDIAVNTSCTNNFGCWKVYKVCHDDWGNIISTKIGGLSPANSCEGVPPVPPVGYSSYQLLVPCTPECQDEDE